MRWAGLLVVPLGACGGEPRASLTYTEVWELMGVMSDGSVIDDITDIASGLFGKK